MTLPIERDTALSRKATLAKARQSRRPSRLGQRAGAAAKPDYLVAQDAGFPGLLKRVWQQATAAPDLPSAVDTLLTLAGHVPADIQLRALPTEQECALKVLFGRPWRTPGRGTAPGTAPGTALADGGRAAFLGEIGLNTSGRVVMGVPSKGPLAGRRTSWAGCCACGGQTATCRTTRPSLSRPPRGCGIRSPTAATGWRRPAGRPPGHAGEPEGGGPPDGAVRAVLR